MTALLHIIGQGALPHYKTGGLDYEWPRVSVVMGGWGLEGSNGELIETQL